MQINTTPTVKPINQYRPYWAKRFGTSKMLPMSREEMEDLGWDSCDIILVTGDAYIDHPSFGMALVGRLLEAKVSVWGLLHSLIGQIRRRLKP